MDTWGSLLGPLSERKRPFDGCIAASLLGASLGGSWKGLGSSSGALGDVLGLETIYFRKMSFPPRREHDFENLYYQRTGSETMRERLFARK